MERIADVVYVLLFVFFAAAFIPKRSEIRVYRILSYIWFIFHYAYGLFLCLGAAYLEKDDSELSFILNMFGFTIIAVLLGIVCVDFSGIILALSMRENPSKPKRMIMFSAAAVQFICGISVIVMSDTVSGIITGIDLIILSLIMTALMIPKIKTDKSEETY